MKHIISLIIVTILLTGCGNKAEKADEKSTVLVSIEPQRKIAEEIAGDKFNIKTVLTTGSNPETYEPTVAQRMATNQAVAYLTTGYLPFETTIVQGMNEDAKIYDISKGIEPVKGTHTHGEETDETADPHIWTSLANGKIIAANMRDAFTEIDPDNANIYADRCQRLSQRLDSLDKETSAALRQSGVHAFAVWHPSLSYYARDYGLHQISVGQESKETSINRMRDVVNEARADSVRVFFFQREFDSRQAESINKEIGSRMVTIDPMNYEWEEQIKKVTNELAR